MTNAAVAQIESHVIVADVVSHRVDRRERLQIRARRRCARKREQRERQSRIGRVESSHINRRPRPSWDGQPCMGDYAPRSSSPLASPRPASPRLVRHAPNARIAIGIVPDRSPRRRRLEAVASCASKWSPETPRLRARVGASSQLSDEVFHTMKSGVSVTLHDSRGSTWVNSVIEVRAACRDTSDNRRSPIQSCGRRRRARATRCCGGR